MDTTYIDMEIGLHRQNQGDTYLVEPRVRFPGTDTDERHRGDKPIVAEIDLVCHNRLADTDQYGSWLTESLFADNRLKEFLTNARKGQDVNWALRLRLYFGSTATALHRLHWEKLRDPSNPDAVLAVDAKVVLSRYLATSKLASSTPRRELMPSKENLRILVAIADPEDIVKYKGSDNRFLARVSVEDEVQRAETCMSGTQPTFLRAGGTSGRPTLNRLLDELTNNNYDILYLVCHGAITESGPTIFLETETGQVDSVAISGPNGLVTRLSQGVPLPRLVVLASCQSASDPNEFVSRDEGALATFGPDLVEIGVPAVVAMQGNVTQQTVAEFMPRFFAELMEHGEIDRAMAVARRQVNVSKRSDWWMPVLFMRLASGRLWYRPGFDARQTNFDDAWRDLCEVIKDKKVIPVVGPGLAEAVFGSPEEIAHQWAEIEQFPMALPEHTTLPELARYLETVNSPGFVPRQWGRQLHTQILRRYTEAKQRQPESVSLQQLIAEMGRKCREREEDPYRVLASLPAQIYVSAASDDLLLDALQAANKDPQVFICPWNSDFEQPGSALTRNPKTYVPSVEQPLVYYPFGRLAQKESLVLSDDDYFLYLIWTGADQGIGENSPLPKRLTKALYQYAKLFLGFQLNDWTLRVLLYSITNPNWGSSDWGRSDQPDSITNPNFGRKRYYSRSVVVQLSPDEGLVVQPEATRSYLEKYFDRFGNGFLPTRLYWGTSQRFVQELWAHHDKWKPED
jgi:hypothetical protein